jgi:C1A family cysteine protease
MLIVQIYIIMHSIVITDYNEELDIYRFKNNWGSNWGYDGYGYTTLKDMNIIDISFLADDIITYSLIQTL